MLRLVLVIGLVVAVAVALAARAWVNERRRREAFPASNALALLSPARRFIQSAPDTVRAFGLQPGDIALEIGPGPGYFTPHATAAVRPGGRLVCLDLQHEMLTMLRERLVEQMSGIDLVIGEAGHLPFRGGGIDSAFLAGVLGEVPDEQGAIGELGRVLRPGGTVSFSETMNDPDYVRLPVMRQMCRTAGLHALDWRRQKLGYIARFTRPR